MMTLLTIDLKTFNKNSRAGVLGCGGLLAKWKVLESILVKRIIQETHEEDQYLKQQCHRLRIFSAHIVLAIHLFINIHLKCFMCHGSIGKDGGDAYKTIFKLVGLPNLKTLGELFQVSKSYK